MFRHTTILGRGSVRTEQNGIVSQEPYFGTCNAQRFPGAK
jgi:hypothetical protein